MYNFSWVYIDLNGVKEIVWVGLFWSVFRYKGFVYGINFFDEEISVLV